MESLTDDIKYSEARHLPIVTAFAQKVGMIAEVDRLIAGQMDLSPGRIVLGLILDTLSGRTPLYRLHEFFAHHDTELLLGQNISAKKFSDDNVGRVLDRIFEVGTQKILGAISLNAIKMFDLELQAVHFDTTSRNLYGDYSLYGEDNPLAPFAITFGLSKDKRPDLKQFVISLLSVDKGIPIFFQCEDGNASDKKLNGHIFNLIAKNMAQLSADDFTYIADSAAITPENWTCWQNMNCISSLVCRLLIKPVVRSSAKPSNKTTGKRSGFWLRLLPPRTGNLPPIRSQNVRSGLATGPTRLLWCTRMPMIKATRYVLAGTIVPNAAKVAQFQQEAGCFVLLTTRPAENLSAVEVLNLYKDQHYIEENFAFLKDPIIINEIFLKKPERIEALGLIFVLALMIWRLIERTMRQTLQEKQDKVPGWDRKPTAKPKAFMMSVQLRGHPQGWRGSSI